jgi:hypothetical protein
MALQRDARYPGRWTAPSPGHPQGAFKNRTAPGSLDGSYIEQDWANDWDGYFSSLLSAAGLTANGNVDAVGASQYYTALLSLTQKAGCFRNIIHNGMFNVNQRGYVSGTATTVANQLTIDRWKVRTSGQNLTFSASGIGFSIVAPAGGLEQVVESINVVGGTYVASWTGAGTLTVNAVAVANGGTFSLPANTNATFVLVGAFDKFQVELGTVPTATEVRPRPIELALCQRYAFVVGGGAAQVIGWGKMATSTVVFAITMYTPVPLRATPTLNDIGTGSAVQITSTTTTAALTPSNLLSQGNIVTFDSGSVGSNTAGAVAGYYIGATSKILLSADI